MPYSNLQIMPPWMMTQQGKQWFSDRDKYVQSNPGSTYFQYQQQHPQPTGQQLQPPTYWNRPMLNRPPFLQGQNPTMEMPGRDMTPGRYNPIGMGIPRPTQVGGQIPIVPIGWNWSGSGMTAPSTMPRPRPPTVNSSFLPPTPELAAKMKLRYPNIPINY